MTTSGFLPIYFFRRSHIFSVVPLWWFLMLTMKDSMLIYNLIEAAIVDIFYLHSFYVVDYGVKILVFLICFTNLCCDSLFNNVFAFFLTE